MKMYHYQTGEEIKEGDRIRYPAPFGDGVIAYVLLPQSSEACAWGIPNGAVMLRFGSDDVSIALDDPENEEDLEFLGEAIPCKRRPRYGERERTHV